MTKDHTALPAGRDIAFMSLGVLGIGTSGPVIANSLMPVPTLIFWRNLGGAIIMSPFALAKREWQTAQQRSAIKISIFSGFLLALHFMGFFIAMRFTSVAAGTALTAVQPIFTAIYLRFKGGTIPKEFIPSVDKGIQDAIQSGVLGGFPVVDVRVTVCGVS